MLDIIEPPSLKNLRFDTNDSTSERAARVPPLLQSEAPRTCCFHDEKLFCKLEDTNQSYLLYLKSNSDVWEFVDQLPFGFRIGQSMTSTFSGMAFFGGANNTTFYNDLWIYMGTTEWFTVPTYIPARKNHAATCDAQGHLIIYGGTGPSGAFNDLYVIDITTQEVKSVQLIDNSPLPRLINHSMTLLKDGTFFLYGKAEINPSSNFQGTKKSSFTYIANQLDIEKCTLTPIQTNFENAIESTNYSTAYIYEMVFLFGLNQNQPIWMFDLTNSTWIPFSMPSFTNQTIRPLYVFISDSFSQKKAIHIVDHSLSSIATIPVFTSSPPLDLHESPQYIQFLKSHLKAGCSYFDNLNVQYDPDSEKLLDKIKSKFGKNSFVNNYLALFENCDLSEDLEKKAEKIMAMMNLSDNQFNISLTNSISKHSFESNDNLLKKDLNVYEILSQTNEIRKKGKEEISKLSADAELLSQQIDQTSFLNIFNTLNSQPQQQQRAQSPDYINLLQKSSQLANEIQFEQSRLAEEQNKIKSLGFTKKTKILNIRYQIWSVTQGEYQKVAQLKDIKRNFFNTVADIYSLRNQELLINDPNARKLAENCIKKPEFIAEIKKSQENLKNIKSSFSENIDDLGLDDNLRQEGSYYSKLNEIANNLIDMRNWVEEANNLLSDRTATLDQSLVQNASTQRGPQGRMAQRSNTTVGYAPNLSALPPKVSKPKPTQNSPNNEYFTRFNSCIGDSEIYLKDMQKVLSKIENDVDIFNF